MAVRRSAGFIAALLVAGCASAGVPSSGIANGAVKDAYLPLSHWSLDFKALSTQHGAAFVVAPHVAVTNAHNANLLPPDAILATSDFDLLFFRTDKLTPPFFAQPSLGEPVIAYGNGTSGELRQAEGRVRALGEYVAPLCPDCRAQQALVFDANAGVGFSGGPVVDSGTGAVLGIVFGYRDAPDGRLMYAYDIASVMAEMHRLLDPLARP
jgi:hypothetical protein